MGYRSKKSRDTEHLLKLFLELVSNFMEEVKTLDIIFSATRQPKNNDMHKGINLNVKVNKKYSARDPFPLRYESEI
jgi:hypothetical protein